MARLFVQFLAIYNNENCPILWAKVGAYRILSNTYLALRKLAHILKITQSGKISPNLVTLHAIFFRQGEASSICKSFDVCLNKSVVKDFFSWDVKAFIDLMLKVGTEKKNQRERERSGKWNQSTGGHTEKRLIRMRKDKVTKDEWIVRRSKYKEIVMLKRIHFLAQPLLGRLRCQDVSH